MKLKGIEVFSTSGNPAALLAYHIDEAKCSTLDRTPYLKSDSKSVMLPSIRRCFQVPVKASFLNFDVGSICGLQSSESLPSKRVVLWHPPDGLLEFRNSLTG